MHISKHAIDNFLMYITITIVLLFFICIFFFKSALILYTFSLFPWFCITFFCPMFTCSHTFPCIHCIWCLPDHQIFFDNPWACLGPSTGEVTILHKRWPKQENHQVGCLATSCPRTGAAENGRNCIRIYIRWGESLIINLKTVILLILTLLYLIIFDVATPYMHFSIHYPSNFSKKITKVILKANHFFFSNTFFLWFFCKNIMGNVLRNAYMVLQNKKWLNKA